ncbi:phosphate ABC transporter permease PstA [Pseudoalteromonas shioyasakiensis]|uniref:phosphate ABC transporter permease PstA n=1 Tax=Pseudoalteromonas TaxID=53246 RepID=UPI000E87EDC4|nr:MULTISPECIES: phosphate ABC transporter permease PstA [Pseudoalteromonas]MCO6356625.1 phosphate ABC transporter permease PstA [Pseudoalteromonas shioyasakiensis]MCO7208158.1 phosphate ABC transporter permease PstA [Pseudoalteromonas sp. CnMc7-37]GKW54058.1 phosphate transport system permease protein PstA [Pseudoalteromonas sp. NCCP-2140]HAU05051.1 phosphate ABC transporter permease PtsA [Pseudoalteromonas shioyasakiensis]|tara:strand:+ start:199 stop:1848 length:1650 start_codon:yes stop_codon:yes gene_type:complete
MVKQWFKSGSPWIWMTGGAVSISLISVLGLLAMIAWKGLSFFWPSEVVQFELQGSVEKQTVIGEIYDRELVAKSRIEATGVDLSNYDKEQLERLLIKTGNREYVALDFRWVLETDITSRTAPAELAVFERSKNGNFYGYVEQVIKDGEVITDNKIDVLYDLVDRAVDLNDQALDLQNGDIGHINYELERLRLREKAYQLDNELTDERVAELAQARAELRAEYTVLEKQLFALRKQAKRDQVTVRDMRGEVVTLPLYQVLDVWFPNDMGFFAKLGHYFVQLGKFVADDPREANTEGGVFPAIFGTVFMVLLMAVIVTPFGVVAAIYLHEYAAKNAVTKMIRIAVINLAGVPSIVYGVFGLGFFVYMLGGSIDQLFYPESSPSPVFGTPGVIWSALTLAILTLPVVIVSTEEGLSRIPSTVRHGSLALGATKAETLWRIIIPMASPAIMTGLILAVARAAGEVAPLMLVGVVKMAPTLPLDGNFPYIHLDRKFMHLGFHIYDVGFQSPNVEAARPLVYATAFLLVSVIIALNITAIGIRNHLREKFRALEH